MAEPLIQKQLRATFFNLKEITKLKIVLLVIVLLILNTLKITLFNYSIIPAQTFSNFVYKFVITLLLAIIFYSFFLRFKSCIPFIVVYVLQTIYIIVNISYYSFYHNYVHVLQWISLFKEAFISAGHSSAPINIRLLIAFIDLPIFAYVIFNYLKINELLLKFNFLKRIILTSLSIVICIEGINYLQGDSIVVLASDKNKSETLIVEKYGTITNNVISLYMNRGSEALVSNLMYGPIQSNKKETKDKPNFVILQVESMDANVINQKYKGEYIAPFLHSLSSQCIYYPYTLSYHMGGGTSDSEFSIINSVQPLGDYPAIKIADYDYPNSLIKQLDKASYNTMAFHGNIGTFYNRDIAFPKMGFNNFFDLKKMNMEDNGWGAQDKDVFNYTESYLKGIKQPFLSYVITMTSHTPFINAKEYYNNENYNDIEDDTVRNYFNSMSYVDKSIGDFINNIKLNFKNTFIIIVGDHTPGIENDYYKQASIMLEDKYMEFVPMLIITPDDKVYKENNIVASFLDISPTILFASGTKFSVKSEGENLINSNKVIKPLPFRGVDYDRKFLFAEISKMKLVDN